MPKSRRLRRLVPDPELVERRAGGESVRALAEDYGVHHTSLVRYLQRPEVAALLGEAGRRLRLKRRRVAGQRAEVARKGAEPEPRPPRLRRLQPDQELIRRRGAGEPLRSLAPDYGVAHTTLSRYFAHPQIAAQLRLQQVILPPAPRRARPGDDRHFTWLLERNRQIRSSVCPRHVSQPKIRLERGRRGQTRYLALCCCREAQQDLLRRLSGNISPGQASQS